jgi:hypothetical protein
MGTATPPSTLPLPMPVGVEVTMQNTTLALLVATNLLGSEDFAIVPGVYGATMLMVIGALTAWLRWRST